LSPDLPTPARALAIGAHPDDVEFGCGATLAKWAEAGAEVRLLVLTDGSKGTWDPAADLEALVATRRREQDASAAVLGLAGVDFLGVPDGELGSGLAERALVCEAIRQARPAASASARTRPTKPSSWASLSGAEVSIRIVDGHWLRWHSRARILVSTCRSTASRWSTSSASNRRILPGRCAGRCCSGK